MRHLATLTALVMLSACGTSDGEQKNAPIRIAVGSDPAEAAMPGKIDPPEARWTVAENAKVAQYGAPDTGVLLTIACDDGVVRVERPVGDDKGAKALLAFVGYRGILRLPVENNGKAWRGALDARDPAWIAVTGGPFYATVGGGGKVITGGPGKAAPVITGCKTSKKSSSPKT